MKNIFLLFAMVLIASGSWGGEHIEHAREALGHDGEMNWEVMLRFEHVASYVGCIGSVFLAWVTRGLIADKKIAEARTASQNLQ